METEEFLEHFGKKGMRWGVRKGRASKPTASGKKKFARNLAIGVAGGAIAGLAIGAVLKKSGKLPVRSLPGRDASGIGISKFNPSAGNLGKFNPSAGNFPKHVNEAAFAKRLSEIRKM